MHWLGQRASPEICSGPRVFERLFLGCQVHTSIFDDNQTLNLVWRTPLPCQAHLTTLQSKVWGTDPSLSSNSTVCNPHRASTSHPSFLPLQLVRQRDCNYFLLLQFEAFLWLTFPVRSISLVNLSSSFFWTMGYLYGLIFTIAPSSFSGIRWSCILFGGNPFGS